MFVGRGKRGEGGKKGGRINSIFVWLSIVDDVFTGFDSMRRFLMNSVMPCRAWEIREIEFPRKVVSHKM